MKVGIDDNLAADFGEDFTKLGTHKGKKQSWQFSGIIFNPCRLQNKTSFSLVLLFQR